MTTGGSSSHESAPDATETFNLRRIDLPRQRRVRKQGGKRSASQTPDRRGRYVRAEPKAKVNDLAMGEKGMAEMQDMAADRDAKLKTVFTDDQMKTWKDSIEPSMRPQRGNRPPGQ